MSFKRKAADVLEDASKKPKVDTSIMSFFGAPKGQGASTFAKAGNSVGDTVLKKFDKEAWVKTLNAEQKKLLQLEIDTMNETWLGELKDELTTSSFLNLKRFLEREWAGRTPIFPPKNEIYSWSNYTPLNKVKAVIIGQDPYHNHNQAHGLCFSVKPPTPAPPSLQNMYKVLESDYPGFKRPPNRGGNLTPWASQGVLMLNTSLTVRAHEAASHSNKGWEQLTQKVIETVAKTRKNGVVFLCWGSHAQKRVSGIDKKKHHILNSVHPSPLSASRGFFECAHFKKTNDWLRLRYGPQGEIDWSLTVKPDALPKNSTTNGLPGKPAVTVSATPSIPQEPVKPKPAKSEEDEFDEGLDDDILDEAIILSDKIMPSSPVRNPAAEEKTENTSKENGSEATEAIQDIEKDLDVTRETVKRIKEDLQKPSSEKASKGFAESKGKENVAVE